MAEVLGKIFTSAIIGETDNIGFPSAWQGHLPFASWMVEACNPKLLVELGSHYGHSYFAFCRAVMEQGQATQCVAIDSWESDEHSNYADGIGVYEFVKNHNKQYSGFSELKRSLFDSAVADFVDGSIDILHIDGLHTYEAVKNDYELWHSKMSDRGVILFHDTCVEKDGFGVWRLWEELSIQYPSFQFEHSHGLGVLAVGKNVSSKVLSLCSQGDEEKVTIRDFFEKASLANSNRLALGRQVDELSGALRRRSEDVVEKSSQVEILLDDLTKKQQDAEGLLIALTEKQQEAEGFLIALTEKQQEAEGFLIALTEKQQEAEGFLIALTEKQQEAEGFLITLTEKQQEADGFLIALTEKQQALLESIRQKNELINDNVKLEEDKRLLVQELKKKYWLLRKLSEKIRGLF
jgi:co-chaperonin GroES (HSP10)